MGLFDAITAKPAKAAAAQNAGLLNTNLERGLGWLDTGKEEGLGYLGTGMEQGQGYLDKAGQAFQPLADLGTKYGGATTMLQNSLGLGGAEGNQAAVNAFQTGPGYQFAMQQGEEAMGRKRAAGNMYNSGNADIDFINYGQGMANQEYGNWQKNLSQFINPELQATAGATAGQAGVLGQQATLANTGYTNMANLTTGDAANRVNLGNMTTQGLTQNNT
ncbi:MAG: hypothetical protein ABWY64_21870, partial [Tardiphaga sp.]